MLRSKSIRRTQTLTSQYFLFWWLVLSGVFISVNTFAQDNAPASAYQGKVVIITGSSSGLGYELTKLAAQYGMKLVLVDIKPEVSEKFAKDFRAQGGEAITVQADLAKPEERTKAVKAARENFGRVDYLFNNAGYSYLASLEQTDLEQAHHQFEVNFWSYVDLAEQVIPMMKAQGGGTILNISSILGITPAEEGRGHYSATKHALVGLFQAAAKELKPHNIKVFIAAPGGMRTNIAKNSVGPMAEPGVDRAANWQDPAIPAKDIFVAMQKDEVVFRPGYVGAIPLEQLRGQ